MSKSETELENTRESGIIRKILTNTENRWKNDTTNRRSKKAMHR